MPRNLKDSVFEAAALTILGVASLVFGPWIDAAFPDLWPWVKFAVPSFTGLLFVFLLYVVFTGKVQLDVVWRVIGEPEVDVSTIFAKLSAADDGEGTQALSLSVQFGSGRGLGRRLLKKAVESGFKVRVELLHSDMVMLPEGVQKGVDAGDIIPGNDCSVEMKMGAPLVTEPGMTWKRFGFRFNGVTESATTSWTVRHSYVPIGKMAKACAKLIKVDAKVVSVVESWS